MTDYAKLIADLREMAEYIGPNNYELPIMLYDNLLGAANAIEELSGKVEQLEQSPEKDIFAAAIDKWGDQAQVMMVFEEMSELQKELCKNWRGRDNAEEIADEVADVEIMLAQLKMIYGIEDKVQEHRAFKLARLAKRLED